MGCSAVPFRTKVKFLHAGNWDCARCSKIVTTSSGVFVCDTV